MRAKVRALRDAIPVTERARASSEILAHLLEHVGPRPPKRLSLFAAIGAEVDVGAIEDPLLELGCEVFYPRVEGERIAFRRARRGDLHPGTWQIPEPPESAPEATVIDLMIVPGVAFDRECRRLGNGKGFYDRAIAEVQPGRTVAVCFHAQIVDAVPVGEHDRVLDAVITERGVLHRALH